MVTMTMRTALLSNLPPVLMQLISRNSLFQRVTQSKLRGPNMTSSFFNDEAGTENNTQEEAAVILRFGTEEVEITPAQLTAGMTVRQLVVAHAEDLGVDADRIASFRDEGIIVPADTVVRAGRVYSIAINAESKGA